MKLLENDYIVSNWNQTDAQKATSAMIAKHNKIDGIVTDYGPPAIGVVRAFKQAELPVPAIATATSNAEQNGGFGSHVMVPNAGYLIEYGDIDPALACTFACSGATVYSAIRKLGALEPDSPVLLVGAGGLGLAAIAVLRALDHTNIVTIDISAEKRQAALKAGATHAFDISDDKVVETIVGAAGRPLQAAIDFVNINQTVSVALECRGKSGKLVLVGVGGGEYPLSLAGMIFRPRSIIGTITGSRRDLRDVVALAQSGKLAPVPLTRMPKDEANGALELLKSGKIIGRIVLESPEAFATADN